MVDGELGKLLNASGLTAYAGPPTGYVLTFSNGLVAYLSGDTGVTAEQKTVVGDQYKAKLVVMNIGDTYTTGPMEAAYVINDLIKTGIGHRIPRQRGRNRGRQGRRQEDHDLPESIGRARAYSAERQDPVVRRRGQMHGRLLNA